MWPSHGVILEWVPCKLGGLLYRKVGYMLSHIDTMTTAFLPLSHWFQNSRYSQLKADHEIGEVFAAEVGKP